MWACTYTMEIPHPHACGGKFGRRARPISGRVLNNRENTLYSTLYLVPCVTVVCVCAHRVVTVCADGRLRVCAPGGHGVCGRCAPVSVSVQCGKPCSTVLRTASRSWRRVGSHVACRQNRLSSHLSPRTLSRRERGTCGRTRGEPPHALRSDARRRAIVRKASRTWPVGRSDAV